MNKFKRNRENQSIGDVLKEFVTNNKLEKGMNQIDIETAWKSVMGPAIEGYTQSLLLKKNTLYVQLSSSVLRQELSYGIPKIITNLNEELGKELINKIILR